MKEISSNKILLYNQETGEREPVTALRGESAYEAAVRLGLTTLSEENWIKEYDTKRDAAIAAIEAKGIETLDNIPDDYTQLHEDVNALTEDYANLTKLVSAGKFTDGGYISANGKILHNTNFKYTDYLDVGILAEQHVTIVSNFVDDAGIAFYDENCVPVGGYNGTTLGGRYNEYKVTIPAEVKYVRLTYWASTGLPIESYGVYGDELGKVLLRTAQDLSGEIDERTTVETALDKGEVISGYYIVALDGNEASFSGFSCSQYIDISRYKGDTLVCRCSLVDSAGLAFYDENRNFVSGVSSNVQKWNTEVTTDIPVNAHYFRYTTHDTHLPFDDSGAYVISTLKNIIMLRETVSVEDLTEKIDYTDGFFVNAGGWITAISPTLYSISDLIPVVKGQKITVTCALATPGVIAGLSRWTRDREFVETIYTSTSNSVEMMKYTAVEDVEYLMICYHHLNGNNDKPTVIVTPAMSGYEAARTALGMLNSHEDKPPTPILPYEYAAGKVLCIGDSLTSGAYYGQGWTGASIQQNYPYYLGRMLNCEVTNGSQSGWSASDWYRDYITTHNYADYDTVIIWLGTNYGCSSMPTDAEIEAFVPDASVSPETANQALYLIKIIETIQAAKPDCFILVCGVFASKADVAANNATVRQIAAKYGLHYVDTMELSTSVKPELHAGVANVHFGKAGNIYIANKFANEIRNIISEDPVLAEFGLTNRTN